MTSARLADNIATMIKTYTFSNEPIIAREPGFYLVWFDLHTTATRSSSIVTRLKLILAETAPGRCSVSKTLGQEIWPKDRAELAVWRVSIKIPVRERKKHEAGN